MWEWLLLLLVVAIIVIRNKVRGYVWKDKQGKKLTFKEFIKRWKEGAEGISPLQQTKTTLWSYPFIVGGIVWGIVMTLFAGTYWMALILIGSFPITIMQIVSVWQRFKAQKRVEESFKEADNGIRLQQRKRKR